MKGDKKMYEIIKNGTDDYVLKYKEKELKFKSDIENIERLQSINEKATEELIFRLAEKGKTIQDITVKRIANGKTYYDNSNKNELLNVYKEQIIVNVISDICVSQFNMTLNDLLVDVGLTDEQDVLQFAQDLSSAFAGKFPSKEKNENK